MEKMFQIVEIRVSFIGKIFQKLVKILQSRMLLEDFDKKNQKKLQKFHLNILLMDWDVRANEI